jgi:hypothetical protein
VQNEQNKYLCKFGVFESHLGTAYDNPIFGRGYLPSYGPDRCYRYQPVRTHIAKLVCPCVFIHYCCGEAGLLEGRCLYRVRTTIYAIIY